MDGKKMTYRQVQKIIEALANEIDKYLGDREREHKDYGKNYDTLLFIAGGLHELEDVEID